MFWRRRQQATPEVSNESYTRWLRASRPPWGWFMCLSELEQEQLAIIGDEYAQDVAVSIGYAVADPQVAETGIDAARGDADAEASLAKKLAEGLAMRLKSHAATNVPPPSGRPSETFAGFGDRRVDEEANRRKLRGARLFGRSPDSEEVAS